MCSWSTRSLELGAARFGAMKLWSELALSGAILFL